MDPYAYCRDKAAPEGSPGYYTVLFQPPAARAALLALLALERELQELVEDCSEPSVAEHKLGFWRQQLAGLAAGGASHPVARALADSAGQALDASLGEALLGGVRRRITTAQFRDAAELDESCARTAGLIGEAMARVVAPGDTQAARALERAAVAAERVRLLRLPRRAGLPPHTGIPLDALGGAGATPQQVDRGGSDPALAALRGELLGQARAALADARRALPVSRGLAATRLQMAEATLRALARSGYVEHGTARPPLPLALLWRAWRCRPRGGAAG